jgi:hypothetical protein
VPVQIPVTGGNLWFARYWLKTVGEGLTYGKNTKGLPLYMASL